MPLHQSFLIDKPKMCKIWQKGIFQSCVRLLIGMQRAQYLQHFERLSGSLLKPYSVSNNSTGSRLTSAVKVGQNNSTHAARSGRLRSDALRHNWKGFNGTTISSILGQIFKGMSGFKWDINFAIQLFLYLATSNRL